MLKLKKLQILGFKSFCDRTEMQFPGTGVVGIVGPNGCGKSNLADAISWVLGEQSAKSLRGGRMEDVIFAGTRDRAATGMAEVSLTLIDPTEYDLGPAAAEAPGEGGDEAAGAAAGEGAEEAAEEAAPADEGWGEEAEAPAEAAGGAVVLTIRKRRKFRAHNRRGEVVVTRRLFRDGESEYLMNGRPCRLRDIQELFLGTGLGPESYAIIEQGRIGQILSSKPYDRRAIIEEAAGVSKYKAKRRLAEGRLEGARLNLARINDIFEEVTRQVGSLKRQAAKAQRYQQMKGEFDGQQQRLVQARAQALAAAESRLREQQAAAQAAVREAQEAIAGQEAGQAEVTGRCAAHERELRQQAEEAGRWERERDHAGQQIAFERQQAGELERRGADNQRERERAEQQSAGLAAELAQAERDRDAAGGRLGAARAAQEEHSRAYAAAEAAVAAAERQREAGRQQTLGLLARAAQLGNQIAQNETAQSGLGQQLERLGREEAAARAELEAGGARQGQLRLAFEDQASEGRNWAARVEELEQQARRLEGEAGAEREAGQKARTQWAEAGARRRSLEEVVAHHGYSSEAVKRLFAERGTGAEFQPLGVLGEFVEVEAPYDRVVEQFLHDELNYVVVKSWDQAGAGVGLLRSQEQGRATFLVHGEEEAAAGAAPRLELGGEAGAAVVPLLGEVKALNGFKAGLGAILPKLRDAYLLQDRGLAQRLAGRNPSAYFLTPQGECFHNFTVSGGAGRSLGPLSLKRELRELRQQEAAAEAATGRHEQQAARLGRELQQAQGELQEARGRRHEMEKAMLTSGQAVRQLEQELERAQARLGQAQLEAERARAEQRQAGERLAAARQELAQVEAERAQRGEQEAAEEQEAQRARRVREEVGQARAAAQAEQARVEERARAANAGWERLRRQQAELEQRRQALRQEGAGLAARRQELLAQAAAGEQRLAELAAALAGARARVQEQEAALEKAQAEARRGEEALRAGRVELEARRQAHAEGEVALARLEAEGEHLRQSCRDDLGCELEALMAAAAEAPALGPEELGALEAAVRELRQRIENLGPINMMALEEFEEAQQRHSFLEAQRKDLMDSIADTQQAIQEMDTISRQKFQEAFDRINEYFQESFRVLFGGGQGFLRMSEIEGASEGGVDIVAQPPGKKLQNALLLSGGEKAMTAMALLLAVFRYQPSPFCLLDEVDAPMDEANVARFSEMVKQMSAGTQFIIITHNKRTMEAAPTLYGVTMAQPGVSRLVSVMVEEARRQAS